MSFRTENCARSNSFMKIRIYLLCVSVILLLLTNSVYSQAKKSTSKTKATANKKKVPATKTETDIRATSRPADVLIAQDAVNKILYDAGIWFKEGLLAYENNQRSDAGEKFNKSVEVFLYSTLYIQRNPKLQGCYNQLVETIYRIEFPSESQLPQIRNLSQTCNWNINNALADKVAAITSPANQGKPGFKTQEFKPWPLDELSKLELTTDELRVEINPVVQQQYQDKSYSVANKSLGFSFKVNPTIQQYIDYYRDSGRTTMEVGLYRSGMFMRMARRIFTEEGVPENITWIGQAASEWKSDRQQGIWNLSPDLGKRFGLQQTKFVDEIKSFDEATRASAGYLKFLGDRYHGNWELAIAAYSSGEASVDNAIKESKVEDYWAIQQLLPIATQDFVANVLATIMIANNPNQYGFGHIRPAPPLVYDRIRLPASVELSRIAQASNTTVQYLRYLNPHLLSNITPPEPYIINVPAGKANEIVALFKGIPTTSNNKNENQELSASGETWQTISNRTGVTVADLMAANPGMEIPRGKVYVPVSGNTVNTTTYSRPTNAGGSVVANGVRVVKAKAGDTVRELAERYNADPIEVAKYNGLIPNSVLGAGREIKIPPK